MYYVGMFYIKMYLHVFIINNIVCDRVRQSAVLRSIEVIIADTLVQVSLLSLMSNFFIIDRRRGTDVIFPRPGRSCWPRRCTRPRNRFRSPRQRPRRTRLSAPR